MLRCYRMHRFRLPRVPRPGARDHVDGLAGQTTEVPYNESANRTAVALCSARTRRGKGLPRPVRPRGHSRGSCRRYQRRETSATLTSGEFGRHDHANSWAARLPASLLPGDFRELGHASQQGANVDTRSTPVSAKKSPIGDPSSRDLSVSHQDLVWPAGRTPWSETDRRPASRVTVAARWCARQGGGDRLVIALEGPSGPEWGPPRSKHWGPSCAVLRSKLCPYWSLPAAQRSAVYARPYCLPG